MDFSLPPALTKYLSTLDTFIEEKINPLQAKDDNERFFDHRREHSRTDWDNQGLPRKDWEELLNQAKRLADEANHLRFALPKEYDGQGHNETNLWMAVIRDHLAAKGLGLFNDLQNEHSIVGNFPVVLMFREFGTPAQKAEFIEGSLSGTRSLCFGLTEPDHGSDATFMDTTAVEDVRDGVHGWRINGKKMWQSGMNNATHSVVFARTAPRGTGEEGEGITAFVVPVTAEGVRVNSYEWYVQPYSRHSEDSVTINIIHVNKRTFNMPTDHATVSFSNVFVPSPAILGTPHSGLRVAQAFIHENRIRQAASSLGAATYCINESVHHARARAPFGKPLALHQGIQFPLVELATQAEMLRLLIRKTAWEMDRMSQEDVAERLSDKVAMCNYWANRLCCEAADRAMQVHGGMGYSRHKPFEHIYRHHRRYRITEGSEEIQMRKIAAFLFGFVGPKKKKGDFAKL